MAKFSFNGMDDLSISFEQLANLTDEDRMSILRPAAELLLERQRTKILTKFKRRTGDLANSLTIQEKSDADGAYAHIFLKGKHRGSSIGRRIKKGRSSGKYSGTNAEIGYILNYGSPRIAATHWLEEVNEESEEDVVAAEQAALDDLMKKKGL